MGSLGLGRKEMSVLTFLCRMSHVASLMSHVVSETHEPVVRGAVHT